MARNSTGRCELRIYAPGPGTAYLSLFDFPPDSESRGCVNRGLRLCYEMEYHGPDVMVDFDRQDRAIGIELLYPPDSDGDEEEPYAEGTDEYEAWIHTRVAESKYFKLLEDSASEHAYLQLLDHHKMSGTEKAASRLSLRDLTTYVSPEVYFDFTANQTLIGILCRQHPD